MKDKFNLVFKPFFLTLIGLIVGYTFINWVLFVELNLFSLKEVITNFLIPTILAGLASVFLVRPRLKVLNLAVKRGSYINFYCFTAWLGLCIPLVIAQEYIVTATGKLSELNAVKEINNTKATKYYSFKKHYIHKKIIGIHSAFDVSGKNNSRFNMHIFVVMPIFESKIDTLTKKPLAWLGVKYHRSIKNRLEENEKEAKYREFANESQRDFDSKNVSDFVYLERIRSADNKNGYIEAVKNNKVYQPNETILIGINEPFEIRNGNKLAWIFASVLIVLLVWTVMLIKPKINSKELKRITAGK